MASKGEGNRAIAEVLHCTVSTVLNYKNRICPELVKKQLSRCKKKSKSAQ